MLFQEALNLFKRKAWDRAGSRLQRFVRRYPDSPWFLEARYLIGECLYELGRYKTAITEYQKVIEADEGIVQAGGEGTVWAPQAMLMQGMSFVQLGTSRDLDAAKIFLEELIRIFPDSKEVERARAMLEELARGN